MFNPLTSSEVVTAIGLVARRAAQSGDPTGDFERDQLRSAYSATRHLAGELANHAPEFERFCEALVQRLTAVAGEEDPLAGRLAGAAHEVERAGDPAVVGGVLCDLLEELRGRGEASAAPARSEVHALLRELADREVDMLAAALA